MQGGPLTVPCVQLKGQPVHNGGCAYVGRSAGTPLTVIGRRRGSGWRALAAASYAADRAVWLVPTMVPLGSHWKQYMSTDTAPSCHRHAGSLNDPTPLWACRRHQ